ncbi:ribosome silencing factor [Orenia marismortui]|uniref:Ribosomal silencing factor RsfS n=1 Tax=Orenia marismortui TaxID=46469 RepID=A0A4R8H046_9FIRM|nr:ribosome silencing factor [Orenia marismortui]TDX51091.1 ribosome-associated protein [Orenia marismortui]
MIEINTEELAKKIAKAADDKKAEDITVLDMRGISILADYFIICSGTADTQVRAIINSIEHTLEEDDIRVKNKEGIDEGRWAVLDYADVIVHVFHQNEREHYQLEKLWGDAKKLDWQQ